MTFEIAQIIKSKQAYRAQLAARPVAEKLRILEELRKRALVACPRSLSHSGVPPSFEPLAMRDYVGGLVVAGRVK